MERNLFPNIIISYMPIYIFAVNLYRVTWSINPEPKRMGEAAKNGNFE